MNTITHKFTLVCDDARREDNGKMLFIGVYGPVLGISQLPIVLPSGLTFVTFWDCAIPGRVDLKIKLQLLEGGTPPIVEARANINIPQPGPAILPIKLGPIQFSAFGVYNLVIEVEGQTDPVITGFTVQLAIQQPPMPIGMPPR